MEILLYVHVQKIIFAKKHLSANVIQCNVFISENERQTCFDVNTSRENYLVVSFHMVDLTNQKHI